MGQWFRSYSLAFGLQSASATLVRVSGMSRLELPYYQQKS